MSDLAAVIKDFGGVGVPSCQPVALPKWTGTVAAGATIQFSIAPATQAISLGAGGEAAGLFTFADLHVSSQCSGTAACSASAAAPCTSAALTSAINDPSVHAVVKTDELTEKHMLRIERMYHGNIKVSAIDTDFVPEPHADAVFKETPMGVLLQVFTG